MALNAKEVMKAYNAQMTAPLTSEELTEIGIREVSIDNLIKAEFDGKSVRVELKLFDFRNMRVPHDRQLFMSKNLILRYSQAGWILEEQFGEDDGPNRPGRDYMILTPITK